LFGDHHHLRHRRIAKRSLAPSHEHHRSLQQEPNVRWFAQQTLKRRSKRDLVRTVLNDPKWHEMWYLVRTISSGALIKSLVGDWKRGGDDRTALFELLSEGSSSPEPLALTHTSSPHGPPLKPPGSPAPMTNYDLTANRLKRRKTEGCATCYRTNGSCDDAAAFRFCALGVRMLDGDVTDIVEARSLALNDQHIDIYSASWGPDDDGKTVDGPGELATRAFRDGIEKGRGGLGSIFVWASGNGGRERDNCNCDGYTNSIWTLSISSATENGLVPWYSEACSSTLATTYSSGSTGERQIITTDLHHGCTSTHTGTSASAPLAAGICALALEANRKLTWRDMQHIVVRTAKPANLHASDWLKNGVNRNVSHSFGYGLMDADAMVTLAKRWTTAPPQKMCMVRAQPMDKLIPAKSHVELKLNVNCENVRFLEHVQAKVTLSATRRGDLHIYLTSPAGTRSTLLAQRPLDNSRSGFQAWPFMSVHTWGESPNGEWKLEIHNDGRYYGKATLREWSLILYGTTEDPDLWSGTILEKPKLPEKEGVPSPKPTVTPSTTTPPKKQQTTTPKTTSAQQTTKTFPVFKPMKPPPSLEGPPNEHESLDNFIHSDPRRPECPFPKYSSWDACVDKCPLGTYPTLSPIPIPDTQRSTLACLRCHYSCKACHGPNDNECSSCFSDADLVDSGFCQPKALLSRLNAATVWYKAMTVAFMTLCVVIVSVTGLVLVTQTTCLSFCCGRERRLDGSGVKGTARYSGLPVRTSTFPEDMSIKDSSVKPFRANDQTNKKPNVKPYRDEDI
ncbi:unnamed protein product, partial [Ixodes hexagonus]